jgi:DNA-binding GntR family transcriptional regulator
MTRPKTRRVPNRLTSGPLPFYYQVANLIRSDLLNGTWPAGSRLSTEYELTKRYGVSRPTIRNAKAVLADEGFIHSIKGSGCYVNSRETWKTQPPTVENLNDIFHFGSKMSFKIHEFGMVSSTEEIRSKLQHPQDRFVFRIRGVRWFQDQPISYVTYYLPFRFGSRIPLESLDENPFIPQIEKLAGIHVVEGVQNISLGEADSAAAKHLGLDEGHAVLVVRTVYVDEERQPIEYVETKYRSELPYSITVRRN